MRRWPRKNLAAIPAGDRVYAIGDIHGRLDLLQKMWDMIRVDSHGTGLRTTIVVVGDYVDRGSASKGVVEFLLQARLGDWELVCLRGNHDQAVLDFIADARFYRIWQNHGAPETLMSYGIKPPKSDDSDTLEALRSEFLEKCPEEHIRFFQTLPYSFVRGDYMFVHAGVRPGIPLEKQHPDDFLWIRDEFLSARQAFEKVIVHGHSQRDRAARHATGIAIDTAAYETGRLSAVVLDGRECRFLST